MVPDFPCTGGANGFAAEGCQVSIVRDHAELTERWQHGPNPEHSIVVPMEELRRRDLVRVRMESGLVQDVYRVAYDWVRRIHNYEAAARCAAAEHEHQGG